MPETAQELTVTNAGQPLVASISPATSLEVAVTPTPQVAANQTVTITPAAG